MADTVRKKLALLDNLFQDGQAQNSITPQDMRDLIVSIYDAGKGVVITEKADLPTPAAGIISLAANTAYFFVTDIDLGTDRLDITAGEVILCGFGSILITLETTHASAMINCNKTLTIDHITLKNDSGPCITFNTGTFRTSDVVVNSSGDDTFTEGSSLVLNNTRWTEGSNGLVISGAWTGVLLFDRCGFFNLSGTPTYFTIASGATFGFFDLAGTTFTVGSGQIGIDIDSAILPTVGGQIINCLFTGAGIPIDAEGAGHATIGWVFRDNLGVENSATIGVIQFSGNALATTINTINVYEDINTSVAFSLQANSERFQIHSDGRSLQYLGVEETHLIIDTNITIEAAGNNKIFEIEIQKNGSQFSTFLSDNRNTTPISSSHMDVMTVVQNDFITIRIRNTTDETNLIVTHLQLTAHRAGG